MLEIYIIDQVYLQLDMKTACTRRDKSKRKILIRFVDLNRTDDHCCTLFTGTGKWQTFREAYWRSIPLKFMRGGWGMKSVLQDSGCSIRMGYEPHGCNEKHGAAYKAVVTIAVRGLFLVWRQEVNVATSRFNFQIYCFKKLSGNK
jgi:hypothetical protein